LACALSAMTLHSQPAVEAWPSASPSRNRVRLFLGCTAHRRGSPFSWELGTLARGLQRVYWIDQIFVATAVDDGSLEANPIFVVTAIPPVYAASSIEFPPRGGTLTRLSTVLAYVPANGSLAGLEKQPIRGLWRTIQAELCSRHVRPALGCLVKRHTTGAQVPPDPVRVPQPLPSARLHAGGFRVTIGSIRVARRAGT
jgi:hypothetical protein